MEYLAVLSKEGRRTLVTFPDCPGCDTFAEAAEDVDLVAREALEGWLEAYLKEGVAPPMPSGRHKRRVASATQIIGVQLDPTLAIRLALRWARQERGLSQGQLAKLTGVTRQQISLLEAPDTNPTLATLQKVAAALGMDVQITLTPKSAA